MHIETRWSMVDWILNFQNPRMTVLRGAKSRPISGAICCIIVWYIPPKFNDPWGINVWTEWFRSEYGHFGDLIETKFPIKPSNPLKWTQMGSNFANKLLGITSGNDRFAILRKLDRRSWSSCLVCSPSKSHDVRLCHHNFSWFVWPAWDWESSGWPYRRSPSLFGHLWRQTISMPTNGGCLYIWGWDHHLNLWSQKQLTSKMAQTISPAPSRGPAPTVQLTDHTENIAHMSTASSVTFRHSPNGSHVRALHFSPWHACCMICGSVPWLDDDFSSPHHKSVSRFPG